MVVHTERGDCDDCLTRHALAARALLVASVPRSTRAVAAVSRGAVHPPSSRSFFGYCTRRALARVTPHGGTNDRTIDSRTVARARSDGVLPGPLGGRHQRVRVSDHAAGQGGELLDHQDVRIARHRALRTTERGWDPGPGGDTGRYPANAPLQPQRARMDGS